MSKIESHGYTPAPVRAEEERTFCNQIPQLFENAEIILAHLEYFHCYPGEFAYTSWPYLRGDGPLCLGHLVLGWQLGILVQTCPECGGSVYVYSIAGSPGSGRNSSSGYCPTCRFGMRRRSEGKLFIERIGFVIELRDAFPFSMQEWVEDDVIAFSWGGNGFESVRKKHLVTRAIVEPLSFQTVVRELSGNACT